MSEQFSYVKHQINRENIKDIALYEIDNNLSDELDEENLFYVYSTSDINVERIINKLNDLSKENKKLKQLLQAIITKEFELSSDDNDYDPLSEFFNNEVSISQIEVEIDVEKND